MENKGGGRAAVAFVTLDTGTLKVLTCWQRQDREERGVLQGKMRQSDLVTLINFLKKLCKELQLFAELEMEKQHKFPKSCDPGCVPQCRVACSWAVNLKDSCHSSP